MLRAIKKQITREEVRAITLAKLRLCHDTVLWDIGAGSGSVSIEADHLMPNGRIFAIEQNEQYQEYLRENLRKFHSRHVSIVEGEALRKEKISSKILVLGHTLPEKIPSAIKNRLSLTVSTFENLKSILRHKTVGHVNIHLKIERISDRALF